MAKVCIIILKNPKVLLKRDTRLYLLVRFAILKSFGFSLPNKTNNFVTSFCYFDHPHQVHDIQDNAGDKPGALSCKS